MTSARWTWVILAGMLTVEGLFAWHGQEVGYGIARTTYQTLWKYAPRPANYVPPQRFMAK